MGQILTNELDKTSTNVATWHKIKEYKTKPSKKRGVGGDWGAGEEEIKKKKAKGNDHTEGAGRTTLKLLLL